MATQDQHSIQDPTTQYPKATKEWKQQQDEPGLQREMTPVPDCGEKTYKGSGRLTGRKAVVTGADSGIGRAAAIAYAREGADVVLSYLPEEEADAKEVVQLIEEAGRRAIAVPGDLKDEKYCEQLIETAVKELGGIDILANVAGKQQFVEQIGDLTTEQFDATFKTNVYSMFWLNKAAVKHMKAGGSIINTSSIQAYKPSPILLDYATTKASINTFSKALAQQVGSKGIRVNVVAPGPVWTPLQIVGGQPVEKLAEFGNNTPLGRAGQPAEMAPAYVFLASQESSYVSGETLNANGGTVSP
ncbi:NAD(P)-dependent dehydrogenase (short-subunit alcohol dehydrogenase family) [Paenibacillus intestini]|uniref:SDR family oxidoreductase n=1 Tax=Paenibacillus cucumis (ex Kampfer et al. 2016) TaxID=1776858 RepID=A0ABS7KHW2_9BACL|nr:SDR family oxidoreductase [Paenibacillus cucumis (ex Kampfer et al. 2016)]MBY0203754.1 SDR family oxidoreductase [Paenibacillus cucumis (ex Kampfer et al. 2016)]MDP9702101.1 NAD(P)-dependent dehydrogenase (short-subunit alcohol dehydrogenase family) [Paenibacillus intestini]